MQQISFLLGITKDQIKLGEALISMVILSRSLNRTVVISKENMIDYLKDINNLITKDYKVYMNNFLMKKLNGMAFVYDLKFHSIGADTKNIIEKWSDYQIDSLVYKYLYTRFWEVIVESVMNSLQTNSRIVEVKLKISPKTYTQFYNNLTTDQEKAQKLIEDIFAFREYNLLTYYLNKKDIFMDGENVIVPIRFIFAS